MNTTKKRLIAAAAAVSVLLSTALLSACNVESPVGKGADANSTAPHAPIATDDILDDTPAPQTEDTNPNTDPGDVSVISDAVVVSAHHNLGSDRVIFECAAVLVGYPSGYSPFEFSVPASAIEFKADKIAFEELEGKLIRIEFSGEVLDSYPAQLPEVTKATYSGLSADKDIFDECKDLYLMPIEEPMDDDTAPVTIQNCVVVSSEYYRETGRVGFKCAAILQGYPGGYTPFTFSVPASAVEFVANKIAFDKLEGKLIDIEFSGLFQETYPMGAAGVTKVTYNGSSADKDAFDDSKAVFDILDFEEEPESCIQPVFIVDNAYVVRTEEMWDGENASILAYAQVGTCGVKDLVEIVLPKKNIKDENGKVVSVSDIEVGRCIEFAFKKISEGLAGSPVFIASGIDYFTVKSESVEVSEETIKSALDAYAIE